jgi:hypothetical protein
VPLVECEMAALFNPACCTAITFCRNGAATD